MKLASRFLSRHDTAKTIHLTIDGEHLEAQPGDIIAAALLAHYGDPTRHSATDAPRTAFCMMGVCFECLVEVDGDPNVLGCMTPVREGMVLRRQLGLRHLTEVNADA